MRTITNDEIVQSLKELDVYGYCRIEGFLDQHEVAAYKAVVEELYEQRRGVSYQGVPARDSQDRVVYNLSNKNLKFVKLLQHNALKTILMKKLNDKYYRFLPPDIPNYYLGYYNARSSGNELDLHIDSHVPSPATYTWAMQIGILLDRHTIENGCTKVVPGSHLSGTFTDRDLKNVKPIVANAGDLVIWDSRLWHGTYANQSGESRWALIATFVMWWVKPSMDLTRSCPPEIYSQLSNEEKALLGFCSIPPKDEHERINTKTGFDALKETPADYFA